MQKLLSGATENNGFEIDGGAALCVAAKLCTIPTLTLSTSKPTK
jgi:hypothetical protein